MAVHHYVERGSGSVLSEELFGDRIVRFLYSTARERAPWMVRLASSARLSSLLGAAQFDQPLASRLLGQERFLRRCGVRLDECVADPRQLDTPRKIFERQIRFWTCRPLPEDPGWAVAPSDARVVVGESGLDSSLFVKGKLFEIGELLGGASHPWAGRFVDGGYAVFRLTPDKYHYNHAPVSGWVEATYEVSGRYHSCNPTALVEQADLLSKNRRAVTVIDTDVAGGTGLGLVAMVEVAALMIGEIVQAYSSRRYEAPSALEVGDWMERGAVKSLFRPGSSTVVLLFEPGRVDFADDLLANLRRGDVLSRYSLGFGQPLVETDVAVRSALAHRRAPERRLP